MKKIIVVIPVILCILFGGYINIKANANEIISNCSSICKIQLQSQSPLKSEHEKYDYTATSLNEIAYLVHYFHSFELSEGKVVTPSDGKSFFIIIDYADGSKDSFTMYPDGICINGTLEYKILTQEYSRLLDFIYALKTKQISLENDVSFDSSEWAETDVQKAINEGFVPKWNQINYKGAVSRLEVCQLLIHFLEKCSDISDSEESNPFSDTSDKSVIMLYHLKMLHGKAEHLFYPYDYMTREEFAKILSNVYDFVNNEPLLYDYSIVYEDQNEISDWAIDSVYKMTSVGLFNGNEKNEFEPQKNITKEEVILVLLRLSKVMS